MRHRQFLEVAGRVGATLGIAGPQLGAETLRAAANRDNSAANTLGNTDAAATLAFSFDGQWLIATDTHNAGRDERWFLTPQPHARTTRVPSIIQETYPAYHGVVWYWYQFEPEPHPYANGRYLLRFNEVDYTADVWLN